jgi:hypothetical protein
MDELLAKRSSQLTLFAKSLADYGDRGWSSEDIARLVVLANYEAEPDEEDLEWLRDRTSLLPPRLLTQLDEKALLRKHPKVTNPPLRTIEPAAIQAVLHGKFTDEEFEAVFPARTKIDLGIRRARASTVYHLYQRAGKEDLWRRWIPQLVNLDYITVANMMLNEYVHGDWLRFWARAKCLNDLGDFLLVAKHVSDLLKKNPAPMALRLRYCESTGVSGYRNPPFQNFDYFEETRKLSQGGETHGQTGTDWLRIFDEASRDVQGDSVPQTVEYLTLAQYIESDLASTAGASTFGKVEWEFEGETGKFKARKNFLLDITTVQYLADETMAHLGVQVNKSFIKPELGKMRIAVTGDIWSYFSQSWLNYLCGGVYLKWPGNTMDERIEQQADRMKEMHDAAQGGYPLPFDFAAFDHQPTTDEVQILSRNYLSRGRINVPEEGTHLWERIFKATITSFSKAVIIARDAGEMKEYQVQGGLPSGIRLTSLIGNYWNTTMTQIAKDNLSHLGMHDVPKSWLRGDDSAIYSRSYWGSLLMRLSYAAINAVGNDSKYGIHYQQSEFLRVWYGETKCFGYPNRALPGIIQRKPWNSEPWDPEGVISAQLSTIDTLERRLGRKLDDLKFVVCQDWSRIRKQSTRWLQAPKTIGGLGLMPFEGWIPSKPWPTVEHPRIRFTNVDPNGYMHYEKEFSEWHLSVDQLKEIQSTRMIQKAASDDIRGLGMKFRSQYKLALSELGLIEWRKADIKAFPTGQLTGGAKSLSAVSSPEFLGRIIRNRAGGFGEYRKMEKWWTTVQEVATVRKDIRPIKELSKYNPDMYQELRRLERKGLHRGAALDYMFGKISGLVFSPLSPLLVQAVESALSLNVETWATSTQKWNRETWAWYTSTIANWYARELNRSQLALHYFQW